MCPLLLTRPLLAVLLLLLRGVGVTGVGVESTLVLRLLPRLDGAGVGRAL
jgi:hypothetical protein